MSKKIELLDNLVPSSRKVFDDFLKTYAVSSQAQVRSAMRTLIEEVQVYNFSTLKYEDYSRIIALIGEENSKAKLITTFFATYIVMILFKMNTDLKSATGTKKRIGRGLKKEFNKRVILKRVKLYCLPEVKIQRL